jgi:hypothetical protein
VFHNNYEDHQISRRSGDCVHGSDNRFAALAKRDMHLCLRVRDTRREWDRQRHCEGLLNLVRRHALKGALRYAKVRACDALGRLNVLLGRREAVSVVPRAVSIPRVFSGESRAGEVNVSRAVGKVTAVNSNEPGAVLIGERVDERLHVSPQRSNRGFSGERSEVRCKPG